jgi:urease accessory protein UreH/RimJ/RimL family protein N-acetyltransferase
VIGAGSGSLTIAARRSGARTILERVRYDGISRCSRAFAEGGAARIVLSQLGPGVVRGDDVTTAGAVGADAHLIVTQQAATRVLGGAGMAHSRVAWTVADRATLELIGEPIVASAGARYQASTVIDLAAGSLVILSEIATVAADAAVRLRTSVMRDGRELFYDAFDAEAVAPHTVGTFAVVGLTPERAAMLALVLDAAADGIEGQRIGIGALPNGAFARFVTGEPWSARVLLAALRVAASLALGAGTAATRIVEATDADFAAMLDAQTHVRAELTAAPGGVETPDVLAHVRAMAANLQRAGHPGRHWLIVSGEEVVGLCGFKAPPADGHVEIGYGIAASRRRRGHAGAAVRAIIEAVRGDTEVRTLVALTATENIASQHVLMRNGFANVGTQFDPDDGSVIVWRKTL